MLQSQREALLMEQVKRAHAAQKSVEHKIFAEREKVNSQSLEIVMLKA